MRIFEYKSFRSWAQDEGLTDSDIFAIVEEMEAGLPGNNLGGNVFKKRIKLAGRGKSGGARTIVAYKAGQKVFFIVGFAKNEKDNISAKEEVALKKLAKDLFSYSDKQLETAVAIKEWFEITAEA